MARGPHRRHRARSWVGASIVILLAGAGLVAPATAAQAAPASSTKDKIQPELAAQMAAKGGGDFWIRFGARADLTAASKIKDWDQRGTAVAAALKKTAAGSQSSVRAELDRGGASYQEFWATNAIKVSMGSAALVQSLANRPEVEGLYAPAKVEAPNVVEGTQEKVANAVEWDIANINADDVWSRVP